MAISSDIEKLERRWMDNPTGLMFAPLAEAYRKAGDFLRALEILETGLEKHPEYVPALIVRGRCHLDGSDLIQAESAFEQALGRDPVNSIALRGLAEVFERTGRNTLAIERLEYLLEVDRGDSDARSSLTRLKLVETQGNARYEAAAAASYPPLDPPSSEEAFPTVEVEADSPALSLEEAFQAGFEPSAPSTEEKLADVGTEGILKHEGVADQWADAVEAGSEPGISEEERLASSFSDTWSMWASWSKGPQEEAHPGPEPEAEHQDAEPLSLDADAAGAVEPTEAVETVETVEAEEAEETVGAEEAEEAEEPLAGETSVPAENAVEPPAAAMDEPPAPWEEPPAPWEAPEEPQAPWEEAPPPPAPWMQEQGVEVGQPPERALASPEPVSPPDDRGWMSADPPPSQSESEPVSMAGEPSPMAEPESALVEEEAGEPALIATESMAELFLRQGHRDLALAVYRQLAARYPSDTDLLDTITSLEGESAQDAEPPSPPRGFTAAETGGASVAMFLRSVLDAPPSAPTSTVLPPAIERGPAGEPTRPSDHPLSLSSVFGREQEGPPPVAGLGPREAPPVDEPETAPESEPSYDEFFGEPPEQDTASAHGSTVRPSDAEDLRQFNEWLKGLKH